jgi:hypothetical protein
MSSPSDFKTHLSYALDNSPLGSRREFTAPQGNNAIETSEPLGFSFHDHAVAAPCLAPRPTNPPYNVPTEPPKTMDMAGPALIARYPSKPDPIHVTPTIIPYFKRVPPLRSGRRLTSGTPTRNTNPDATPSSTPIPAMTLTITRTTCCDKCR